MHHTPGLWKIVTHEDMYTVEAERIDGGRELCSLPTGEQASYEANVRLIAAAPDMLEALGNIMYAAAVGDKIDYEEILAAFNKARGNTP